MRVLGIDYSTKSIAYCIFEEKPIFWGKLLLDGDLYGRVRKTSLYTGALVKMINGVDVVAIEAPVMVRNGQTAIKMSMIAGGIAAALGEKEMVAVAPMTWQSAIGNKKMSKTETRMILEKWPGHTKSWYNNKQRSIRKDRTKNFIQSQYGIEAKDDDISDAIAIAHYTYWSKS